MEMLTGKPPLSDLEPAAAMFRIGSRPIEPTLPENVSLDAKEFVKAALTWLVCFWAGHFTLTGLLSTQVH